MTPAEALAAALLSDDPLAALRTVRPMLGADPSLLAVVEAAERQLGAATLPPDGPEAAALRTVSGHPGLTAEELEALSPGFRAASIALLERGLVTSSRFERSDCWAKTAAGALLLRSWG